jgi:hypothetical protein
VIDLQYDSVLGPILYKRPISEHFAERLIGQTVLFFIPTSLPSVTGTNVYSYSSSLTGIALHQGIAVVKRNEIPPTTYSKCVNVFSDSWTIVRQERRVVRIGTHDPVGIELVITFTPRLSLFESSQQFDIKSKSARTEMFGMALVFGQPAMQRYDTFRLKDLCSMDFETD